MQNDLREAVAHEIYDFLDERFPDASMPGGVQLFADPGDTTDANMNHEAGCFALADRILDLALGGQQERAVMVCPQCEGEGSYADGVDESACSTECTRCGGNGWTVDLSALSNTPARAEAQDEGAAGEREAIIRAIRENIEVMGVHFIGHDDAANAILAIRRAPSSPPPAADEDRVRIGPDLVERLKGWPHHAQGADYSVASIQALMTEAADALKSTAAKEGEKK